MSDMFRRWPSSFTPLNPSSTGGMGKAATTFYKPLPTTLGEKREASTPWVFTVNWALPCYDNPSCVSAGPDHQYTTQQWIWTPLNFNLLRVSSGNQFHYSCMSMAITVTYYNAHTYIVSMSRNYSTHSVLDGWQPNAVGIWEALGKWHGWAKGWLKVVPLDLLHLFKVTAGTKR